MKLETRRYLITPSKYSKKCPYTLKPTTITIHNTYNDAPAINEIKYMISNNSSTSFHWAVDDKEAVLGIPEDRNAWHCGNTTGNRNSLSIEICYSRSGGERFDKAEENAAYLAAEKLKQYGLGIDKLRTHQSWSGKYCPHRTLDRGWDRFVKMVSAYMNDVEVAPPKTNTESGYMGNSIVDYLHSIGEKSSFANRKMLAQRYGISNYKGTAEQNLELLNKMRAGNKPAPAPTQPSGYTGNSIVDYLVSIGQDSSFANRKKLASQYGISNYKGTASQNSALLNKMRGEKPTVSTPVSSAQYISFNSRSIVDGLKSKGIDSSRNNRARIAKLNGITNYSGTGAQNEKLCNLARKGSLRVK